MSSKIVYEIKSVFDSTLIFFIKKAIPMNQSVLVLGYAKYLISLRNLKKKNKTGYASYGYVSKIVSCFGFFS